ncbi:MAG: SCO family protein [Caulobacteraceae bacterium]|nr:SCO family protein [Caulobacter sp.]
MVLAVAALLALALLRPAGRSGTGPSTGQAAIGGPFRMVDQDGRPVDQGVLRGKWNAVFFGYVSCPDTCPATLQTLAAAQDRLGARGNALRTVFVTVDPERDTPAQMKVYLSQPDFPRGSLGLTGTPAQVAEIAKQYRVYYQKVPHPGGGYDMDHSAAIYLMDPQGRFVMPLQESLGPQAIADQIGKAMAAG